MNTSEPGRKTGLYIHIPFCVKKCNYCAFLSFDADTSPRKEYSEALINEIKMAARRYGNGAKRHIDTVYIGGGTPSVMDVSQMSLIMKAVRAEFDIDEDAEITLEANPGTIGKTHRVTTAKLIAYKYMGVNRLSFGVQSMDNGRLSYLGRIHTMEDVERDIRYARDAGFDNINLDIIFSVPGETTEQALSDARRIIALGPEHISCYSLQLEEGTPFFEMAERGELREVDDEDDRRTYHRICDLLAESGYEHYEISNFARTDVRPSPGFGGQDADASPYRSKHNSSYWNLSEYIGVGLGASGFMDGVRYRNTSDLAEYLAIYGAGDIDMSPESTRRIMEEAYEERHENTPFDNASEAVFTGLRRREGVTYEEVLRAWDAAESTSGCTEERDPAETTSAADAEERFWQLFPDAREEALEYRDRGPLQIDSEGMRLTREGIDISNSIMSLFV